MGHDLGPRTRAQVSRGPVAHHHAQRRGEASPALERAAGWERTYVLKDFCRLGIMLVLMTALLAASGVVALVLR